MIRRAITIQGAEISGSANDVYTTFSDSRGRFQAHRRSDCYVPAYPMAKLRYNIFDPQDQFPGHYQIMDQWLPDCMWMPQCELTGDLLGAGPTLAGQMTGVAVKQECAQNNIINDQLIMAGEGLTDSETLSYYAGGVASA